MTTEPLINLGGEMWCLFPWLGTYSFMALERFLKLKCGDALRLKAMDSARPYYIQFRIQATAKEFFRILADTAREPLDPLELVYPGEVPVFEKYDEYLPDELIRKGFAYGILNIGEMKERIFQWEERLSRE